jgi:hypothetical protein
VSLQNLSKAPVTFSYWLLPNAQKNSVSMLSFEAITFRKWETSSLAYLARQMLGSHSPALREKHPLFV